MGMDGKKFILSCAEVIVGLFLGLLFLLFQTAVFWVSWQIAAFGILAFILHFGNGVILLLLTTLSLRSILRMRQRHLHRHMITNSVFLSCILVVIWGIWLV